MPVPFTLTPGTPFAGDYRVIRPLSEGGMGAVYVVEQLSTGRERALKVMHPALVEDAEQRRRFIQEARVGALIQSDHVVHVLAAGVDEFSGIPWLVMELLEGETLSEFVRQRGDIPPREVYRIFVQICHALGAAHRAGIVHRDLKPENVFLAKSLRADVPYTVKLLDFGIAKVLAQARLSNTAAVGTPLYMAPEQTVAGSRILPGTDVWALGLLAFRLLTGRSYWRAGNDPGGTAVGILREVVLDDLPPASSRAREWGSSALSGGFDSWFRRCLSRDLGSRFTDASLALAGRGPALGIGEDSVRTSDAGVLDSGQSEAPDAPLEETLSDSEMVNPALSLRGASGTWIAGGVVVLAVALAAISIFSGPVHQRGQSSGMKPPVAAQPGICPRDMAYVAGGQFTLRVSKNSAAVSALCVEFTEVTAGDFADCVESQGCALGTSGGHRGRLDVACDQAATYGHVDRLRHPMNCVSNDEAASYCEFYGRRLPTEAEWEWVGRGGVRAFGFPWGNQEPGTQLCWSGGRTREGSCPVGSFPTGDTAERVQDMSGGVAEWTSSDYGAGSGARVYRGGSWAATERNEVRIAKRGALARQKRGELLGFRCFAYSGPVDGG